MTFLLQISCWVIAEEFLKNRPVFGEDMNKSLGLTFIWPTLYTVYPTVYYSVRQKKVSPKVICHFLSNHLEFLCKILQVCYLFIYTLKCQAAFDCLQLLQSYRIFCVAT